MNYKHLILMVFVVFIAVSFYLGYTPLGISVVFLLFSLLAFFYYAKDKKAAINGAWRVPESTLHLLSLCCGWPGALIAQENLRHKTKKLSFQLVFWCTVLVNVGSFAWIHTPQGKIQLRNSLLQLGDLTMTHVKSGTIISTVLFLTEYRPKSERLSKLNP